MARAAAAAIADLNDADDIIPGLSITQRFNHELAFRQLLHDIGVIISKRNQIIGDGFTSLQTLVEHYRYDVNGFASYLKNINKAWGALGQDRRIFFNPVIMQRLLGLLHYASQAYYSFHITIDTDDITAADATNFGRAYNDFKSKANNANDDDNGTDVSIPVLTGSSNWVNFRDKFLMKLNFTFGARGTSLSYIVDGNARTATRANQTRTEVISININDDDRFITHVVHFGEAYKSDNSAVWTLLKNQLLNTPPYNHISQHNNSKNGRAAWNSLKTFYEGEDFQQRNRELAFTKLSTTFYRGETHRFNFEKYIAIHKEAHKQLEDAGYNGGVGLDDETKVQHFKTGIKVEAQLEHAISAARANPMYHGFDQFVSYMSAEVDHKALRKSQMRTARERNVSSIGSRPDKPNNGNQGDSSWLSKFAKNSMMVGGRKVFAKQYSKEEFGQLTKAQRGAVIKMNKANRIKNKQNGNPSASLGVSAIESLRESVMDDMITVGNAIVAGVAQASNDNNVDATDATSTSQSTITTATGKRSAQSGGIGDFIHNRRKNRRYNK
jgi:hypothetical protein